MDFDEKEITLAKEDCKLSITETNKTLIKAEILPSPEEDKTSYMDIQMSPSSDLECNDDNITESTEKQIQENGDGDENKNATPCGETSSQDDDEKQILAPGAESDVLLSVIEEERSASPSASEVTETADSGELIENEEKKDEAAAEVATTEISSSKIINDEKIVVDARNDQMSSKENQILKARIAEVNEQLHNARSEITELKKAVVLLEEETKNPEGMSSKLSAHIAENEELKQEIIHQKNLNQAAAEKETHLLQQVSSLSAIDKENSETIKKKQLEIEQLKATICDLTNQSSSIEEKSNKNGRLSINARDAFGSNSSTDSKQSKQHSKICMIV